jgi:hypothetical protein
LSLRALIAASGLVVAGLAASPALAQLEDGRGLERDLRTGPGPRGNTPRASMADEVRLRNAIVTGNVGGLKSFRGNVGYTAPEDFRGRLGSDSTFNFRRDSTSAAQVRGGESLRTQFSLTTGTGRRKSENLMTRFGATGTDAARAAPGQASFATNRDLRATPRQGTLRSTAAFAADASLSTTIVGYEQTDKGWEPVRASSLMGVRRLGTGKIDRESDLSARRREDEPRPGLQQPLDVNALSPAASLTQSQLGKLNDSGVVTVYDDLRRRMDEQDKKRSRPGAAGESPKAPEEGEADAGMESSSSSLDARLKELRERMTPGSDENEPTWQRILRKREAQERAEEEETQREGGLDPGKARDGDADRSRDRDKGSGVLGGAKSSKSGKRRVPLDDETLRLIMEAGGQTKTFIDPATGKRDLFAEQMASGQELMARARYFDAEERFAAALQARPGDVTAQAGRLHSQLGAGLYLSAALNLRTMLQQAPEVVGLRYTGATIPTPDRLAAVGGELRANAQRAKDAGLPLSSGEGLLLAYVGWQMSDQTMIKDGLTIARAGVQRAGDPGTPAFGEDEAMLELMEKAWLATPAGK